MGGNLFIISRLLFPCYIFFISNKFINFELETSQVSPTLCLHTGRKRGDVFDIQSVQNQFEQMKNIMKKALITGANKGIGYEIARHLGKAGWQVIIGARDEERAKKAMETLKADGVKAMDWQYVNLSDNKAIEISANEISDKYPDLSLLVNNAGIPGNMAVPSYEQTLKDVIDTLQVNYVGTFYLTKLLPSGLGKQQRESCEYHRPFSLQSLLASHGLCSQ